MDNIKEIISQNILYLRKLHNLTQSDLAEKINYSDKAISRWEKGEALPDIETLNKLANVFNVNISYMCQHHDDDDFVGTKPEKQNILKLVITLLSVSVVWMTAIVLFFYLGSISQKYYWQIFIWALPCSAIITLYYNYIYGNKKYNIYIYSGMLWSFITAIYCHYLPLNLWLIFLIGLPIQTIFIINYLRKPFKKPSPKTTKRRT